MDVPDPRDELLEVANRAIADSQELERHGLGLRIDLDGLSIDDAADTIRKLTAWPASESPSS